MLAALIGGSPLNLSTSKVKAHQTRRILWVAALEISCGGAVRRRCYVVGITYY